MINLIRTDIASRIANTLKISPDQSKEFVDTALNEMIQHLKQNGELKINRFGTFKLLHKVGRPGRNPKTGEEVLVTPRVTVSFKPSAALRKEIKDSLST